jgi:hypothetical protein
LLQRFFKDEVEIGERGDYSQAPGHILNITDGFTNIIILTVTQSAILSL